MNGHQDMLRPNIYSRRKKNRRIAPEAERDLRFKQRAKRAREAGLTWREKAALREVGAVEWMRC